MRPVGSKYLLEEPLGRGASGTVWLGRIRESDEPVAVKVLREELATDPDVVARFIRERSLLLRVRHPHLVRVRDLVVEGELLALVMDLVDGPDLRVRLRDAGPMTPAESAFLMAQVTAALAAAHATGIVHRDLKPGNILLASADGAPHAMLTDFGIARLAEGPKITRTHEFLGTPAYLAPETALGQPPAPAVDVYAAGVMLWELVTGSVPFRDDNPLVVMRRHIEETPARPAGLPDPLWSVIDSCLAKDGGLRPTAEVLSARLGQLATALGGGRPGMWPGAPWTGGATPTRGAAAATAALPYGARAGRAAAGAGSTLAGATWQASPAQRQQILPDSYFRPPAGSAAGPSGTRVFPEAPPTSGYPPQPAAPPVGRGDDIVWPRHEVVEPEPERYAPPPTPPAPPARERQRRSRPAPAPRPARPPMRPWRIPGLGCLVRLVVLVAVGALLWHMFGVSARIQQTQNWFHQVSADLRAAKDWLSNLGGLLR